MTPQETNTHPTIDDALAKLQTELAENETRRTRAQQEADMALARIKDIARRMSAIQVATTTLAGLPSLDPYQSWVDNLVTWRNTLTDELRALPMPIRDARTLGLERNLMLSLRVIELGPDAATATGYDMTTLRLGALMIESGYEVAGADPDRHYAGELPWFGSLSQVERRIATLKAERAEAQARLADALLDDAERERLAAENKARIEALNALPVRKVRGDGFEYDRYPDGRRVEVTS